MVIKNESLAAVAKSAKTRIFAAIFLTLICAGTVFAAALSTYTVEIVADGVSKTVQTSEIDAKELVKKEGYTLGKNDELDTSDFKPGENNKKNKIVILRARNITINDNGVQTKKVIAAATVKDALKKAGVTISKFDVVTPKLDSELKENLEIIIKRAYLVEITADGQKKTVEFVEGTVADVLKLAGITLGANDEVTPALDTQIAVGSAVSVNRVSYQTRVATEIIKYSTSTKKTVNLYAGQTGVEQNGVNGEKIVTYQDKIVNGVKSSSKAVSTQITKSPVNCVRLIGIKVKVLSTTSPISSLALPSRYSLDKDGIPTSIIDTITGKAKSYTCNSPSYKGKGGTASGVKAQSGYIAVNPKQIPYGTEMYIVSSDGKYVYGYCIAADTGGFATAGTATVDLYMDTLSECRQWGSRN
ncbi:MAG: ubiquitin-like domain-containing protein, partial [Oscillospiraceae bacterium]